MSTTTAGGRSLFKGVNTQAIAAMSLFLQYLDDPSFQYMGLEGEKLEDFHLVFEDAHKIIGESKDLVVAFALVREILGKVADHKQVNKEDEILIVCKKLGADTQNVISNFKYFQEQVSETLVNKHNFEDKHINLLPQLRFWEFGENRDKLESTVLLLTAKKLGIWVPQKQLEEIVSKRLVEDIYKGSEKGSTVTKDKFVAILKERASEIAAESGYYQKEKAVTEKVAGLLEALKDPCSPALSTAALKSLTDSPDLHFFALDRFRKQSSVTLCEWDEFWQASTLGFFAGTVFDIFKNNTNGPENQKYLFKYVKENLAKLTHPYSWRFCKVDIVKICKEILGKTREHDSDIFEVIEELLSADAKSLFYLEQRRDERWETEEVGKLLFDVYEHASDQELKQEIVGFLKQTFNLIQDEGKYWHHTPSQVFDILPQYILEDPQDIARIERRTKELTLEFVRHYTEFYKKFKSSFKGWELMGFGIGQLGKGFSIRDRHFVDLILKPAINKYHRAHPEKAWDFITGYCITRKEREVSPEKPDFLNRAVVGVLLKEYGKADGEHHVEATEILKDFVRMRKGIPHKTEIIYQEVRNSKELTDDQKWELVQLQLGHQPYKSLPANVFVEQIVSDLASKSYDPALAAVTEWINNPEYNVRHIVGGQGSTDLIEKLIGAPETFNRGVALFRTYISGPSVMGKDNSWEMWDASDILTKILDKKPGEGLEILKSIWDDSGGLNFNQQILATNSIQKVSNGDVLVRVYEDFLRPRLERILGISLDNNDAVANLGNITPLEATLRPTIRENLVEFAQRLAQAKKFEPALELVRLFILDSDPPQDYTTYKDTRPDDPDETFNYGKKVAEGEDEIVISTVRGRCAWALQKFITSDGRDCIANTVPLVQKLAFDGNPYVRLQACVPLIELVKNRHTVMPNNSKERFLAFEVAEEIEELTFELLHDSRNQKIGPVMKSLARVFTGMRTVSEEKSKDIVKTFLALPLSREPQNKGESVYDSVINEFSVLLVYYAEFRNKNLRHTGVRNAYGEHWEELQQFDEKWFKSKLENLLETGSPGIKHNLAWRFWQLPKEKSVAYDEVFPISYYYLSKLTGTYDHEIFGQLYYFIDENMDRKFEDCFNLWKACLEVEKPEIEKLAEAGEVREVYWWPNHWNGKILLKILENKGPEEFLEWLSYLVSYPKEITIAGDLENVVEKLVEFPNDNTAVGDIFDRLIERNPKYFDTKQRWLEKDV